VPGYPWLLSVIHRLGGSPAATLAAAFHVQIVLGALTVVLTYLVARRVLSVALAVVPALLMAVVPHQVVAPSFLLTETLFCFLLMSALYALLLAMETGKQRFWVLFALLVAYATL